jgi:hypothetical protein
VTELESLTKEEVFESYLKKLGFGEAKIFRGKMKGFALPFHIQEKEKNFRGEKKADF